MHNPFSLISVQLMEAMLKEPTFFVREYYYRGFDHFDDPGKIPLLLTYYQKEKDTEYTRAFFHHRQIAADHYAFLYDTEIPEHRERLLTAATQPSPYKIYINLLPAPWAPPHWLRNRIHEYMQHHLNWWNYNKTNSLHIHLNDRYGKLFLLLSWKGNSTEVLLEEIENFRACATT